MLVSVAATGCPADDFHIDDASSGVTNDEPMSLSTTSSETGHGDGDGPTGVFDTGQDDPTADDEADGNCGPFYGSCPDGGSVSIECDVWVQDCPVGEKCMPWANDGGLAWNATTCSPLSLEPQGLGEQCAVEGSGVSGFDDCDIGSMCWDVDPMTNQGRCVAFCTGDEAHATCTDPAMSCAILVENVIPVCLPVCDPNAQACSVQQACYPLNDTFACLPDAGAEMGSYGEACEFVNVCDPGWFCGSPDGVPDCAGSFGCCSEFCNLLAPEPDLQCTGQPQGQACVPWYEDGHAPPGLEDVGACLIPV